MPLMRSILPFLILPAALGQFASQLPLDDLRKDGGKVVNEELSSYIQNVLDANNFPGVTYKTQRTQHHPDARARSAHLVMMRRELSGLKVMRELSGEISPLSPRTLV
ncbi:hypothetical protein B0H14DRAFT_2555249 [Mycena olivaceomarginata]|nr:hypothetical protein B0H14DRAFT_2555249 [Mycena olivaceomarginata]